MIEVCWGRGSGGFGRFGWGGSIVSRDGARGAGGVGWCGRGGVGFVVGGGAGFLGARCGAGRWW